MATTTELVTADELFAMPEDGHRYDLIRGRLYRMPAAGGRHGEIEMELGAEIRNHAKARGLGRTYGAETGFLLARDPDTVLAPDVAFVRADRLPPPEARIGFMAVAPDLVVEVVSPSNSEAEIADKVRLYLDAGVRLALVVRPRARTITIHAPGRPPRVLRAEDEFDGGDVLPGFRLRVGDIFA